MKIIKLKPEDKTKNLTKEEKIAIYKINKIIKRCLEQK